MRINVTETLKDYENNEVTDRDANGKEVVITIRKCIFLALNNPSKDEVMDGSTKEKCFELTKRAYDEESPNFTTEELSFIADRMGKVIVTPLLVGRFKEIINKT